MHHEAAAPEHRARGGIPGLQAGGGVRQVRHGPRPVFLDPHTEEKEQETKMYDDLLGPKKEEIKSC